MLDSVLRLNAGNATSAPSATIIGEDDLVVAHIGNTTRIGVGTRTLGAALTVAGGVRAKVGEANVYSPAETNVGFAFSSEPSSGLFLHPGNWTSGEDSALVLTTQGLPRVDVRPQGSGISLLDNVTISGGLLVNLNVTIMGVALQLGPSFQTAVFHDEGQDQLIISVNNTFTGGVVIGNEELLHVLMQSESPKVRVAGSSSSGTLSVHGSIHAATGWWSDPLPAGFAFEGHAGTGMFAEGNGLGCSFSFLWLFVLF